MPLEIRKKKKDKKKKIKSKLHYVWAILIPISTTKDVMCCSDGYIYHFLDFIKLLLFVNARVVYHVWERGVFVGENAKGADSEIYQFHKLVISTHFFDQVQIFFFFTHCIVI